MIKACKRGEKRNQDLKNRILDEKRFVPQFIEDMKGGIDYEKEDNDSKMNAINAWHRG